MSLFYLAILIWHNKCITQLSARTKQILLSLVGFSVVNKRLTLLEGLNMNTISKFKISFVTFLSLCSTSVFAGLTPPVVVSEPSILALLGAGAVIVLYAAKKRKK